MKNRAFIALVTIVIMVLGLISLNMLRRELIPPVELPTVAVTATNPGASSEQMAQQVAEPIERQLTAVDNVTSTSSNSSSNFSMIMLEMEYGSDIFRAASQTDTILNTLEDQLPDGTTTRTLTGGSASIPAMVVSMSSELSPGELNQRFDQSARSDLENIPGIAQIQLFGVEEEIIRINPDDDALTEHGLDRAAIVDGLEDAGVVLPGGNITDSGETLDISIGKAFDDVDDLAATLLAVDDDQPVQLSEVADIDRTQAEAETISRTNGNDSITLLVIPSHGANFIELSEAAHAVMDQAAVQMGSGTEFTIVFDQAEFIEDAIAGLANEGMWGLILAVLVIFVFLLSIRPTIITGISIPLSVLFAFVGMLSTGTTMNMMSLAGLMITIGRMVDDSIVVIENIMRHLRQAPPGETKGKTITRATAEVSAAVISSTVVTVMVFVPILLVEGLAGELFRPFALTVVLAMIGSTLIALTIVPVLAYWFMRNQRIRGADANQMPGTDIRVTTNWLSRIYRPIITWTIKSRGTRWITALGALVVFAGSLALVPALKVNLLGDTGMNMHAVTYTAPQGSSLQRTSELAQGLEEELAQIEQVETVQTDIGGQSMMSGAGPNQASLTLITDPAADQSEAETHIQTTLETYFQDNPDIGEFQLEAGGALMGSDTVDVRLDALDDDDLAEASETLKTAFEKLDDVARVESDYAAAQPSLEIVPLEDEIAQYGMTVPEAMGLIASHTTDFPVSQVTIDDAELNVHMDSAATVETVEDIENLDLFGIPLTDIAEVNRVNIAPSVSTIDAVRTVTISVTPASTDNVGATTAALTQAIDSAQLPEGVQTELAGVAEEIDTTFQQLALAMAAAILLIYVVLVWQLKSLVQPLILLVAIPFGATGMILALLVTDTPLGATTLVGMLMLIGIVVTNSIVLMDLINQYRRRDANLDQAIIAGAQNRVRPIIMTAAATIGAMIPPALGLAGQSSFVSAPMSIAVIGGLIASTLITLVIVPVLYRMTEGTAETLAKRQAKREQDALEIHSAQS
ncbi:MAG TPA: efflux RND transporter permease subunit [Enteractinococcus helveticum]|uniref:Efflux RND transporter permease subunit n=1 Tax=Enteractinococcus helveticum TaxID=1837282 RepID=A0A921K7A8_9MICC|nr:efflux RND transporter permease subunit [Enteractinococcus helveticum]HJF14407.1 efflux RND transporter permease subunit [Enteractinococcus helveticum]